MSGVLKPCPFCGGNGRFSYGFGYEIYCEECGSRGNTYPSKEQAIVRWNKRLSPWHTGEPTEEGWYVIAFIGANKRIEYASAVWCYNEWDAHCRILAWQNIEPFKEDTV